MNKSVCLFCLLIVAVTILLVSNAHAQTTEFTFQGSLSDNSQPANGSYDFEFLLFDSLEAGSQVGSTVTRTAVAVTDGRFSVMLDFGDQFPGAGRWLEIRLRLTGQPGITTLAPRQVMSSAPYSVKSLNSEHSMTASTATNADNSLQLGGVAAGQFVVTSDPRMTDARPPAPDSTNYIQNTTTQQASSDFSISGTGKAELFDAAAGYHIGGDLVLSIAGISNVFAGRFAGEDNDTGNDNTFVGRAAGRHNTGGNYNSIFGANAGVSGGFTRNSIFGAWAGNQATGSDNSLFGYQSGFTLTSGFGNAFFGNGSGNSTSTGIRNTFIGPGTGTTNTTGNYNVALGRGANMGAADLTYATAIGSDSIVTASNTVQLGRDGSDTVRIGKLGSGASTALCLSTGKAISTCSSSIRYKSNIEAFSSGIDLIRKLRPVSFNWKDSGALDIGLVAEEVAEIEPLLVTYNAEGQIEGVKYDRVGVIMVNAVKEQQRQIEHQKEIIGKQQSEILQLEKRLSELEKIKSLVCKTNQESEICR